MNLSLQPQLAPALNAWQRSYPPNDRQRAVQFLVSSLKEMQGSAFDQLRGTAVASEFEKFTFLKSPSKDEYLRLIRQKIAHLRSNPRQQGQSTGQTGAQQAPVPPQPDINPQSLSFLQQQAQARQQLVAHIQSQMRAPHQAPQSAPQGSTPHIPGPSLSAPDNIMLSQQQQQQQIQLQQITNMIKNSQIPPALLSKIPNLPPDVSTWAQIYDCFKKRIIPESAMPLIKEIHHTHVLIALRQQQHQQSLQRLKRQPQGQQQAQVPVSQANVQSQQQHQGLQQPLPGMNMVPPISNSPGTNNMYNTHGTTQPQNQQLLQRQIKQQQQQQQQQHQHQQQQQQQTQQPQRNGLGVQNQSQLYQQQQQQLRSQSPPMTNMSSQQSQTASQQQQPNFQVTAQDFIKYKTDAMTLLLQLQANRSIQPNLDQNQKDNFIRKYILHQKAQLWKQQQAQQAQQQQQPVSAVAPTLSAQTINQQRIQQQQQHLSQLKANAAVGTASPQLGLGQTPVLNNSSSNAHPMSSPSMDSLRPPASGNNVYGGNFGVAPAGVQSPALNMHMPPQATRQAGIPPAQSTSAPSSVPILPQLTDEMRTKLRLLVQEASQNPVILKDVSAQLSPQEKSLVQEMVATVSQQYSDVDSIISYFYMLTRNEAGTKRLIQMKYMTKNIMDKLPRGIYLAESKLLEKLSTQYRKYFDYVKNQFALKKLQLSKQQQQQTGTVANTHGGQFTGPNMAIPVTGSQPNTMQQQQQQRTAQNIGWAQNVALPNQHPGSFTTSPLVGGQASPVVANAGQVPQQQVLQQHMQQQMQQRMLQQQQQQHLQLQLQQQQQQQQQQILQQQQLQQIQQQLAQKQKQGATAATPVTHDTSNLASRSNAASQTKRATTGNGRRKGSAKGPINVANIPTPAGSAPTPGAATTALKTPNSISTPQVGGQSAGSSKNTPSDQQSPPNFHSRAGLGRGSLLVPNDVFSDIKGDSPAANRRELLNSSPEKFFFAALANALDLDDPMGTGEIATPKNISVRMGLVNSPLSPQLEDNWCCELRPVAICAAFKQADYIREIVSADAIGDFMPAEVEAPVTKKRTIEDVVNGDDDMDMLFGEKKPKFMESCMYETMGLDDWKQFVVSTYQ